MSSAVLTQTIDYRGNLGILDFNFPYRGMGGAGPFAILKDDAEPIKETSITDGFSVTVFAWETIGAGLIDRQLDHFTWHLLKRKRSNSPQTIYFENVERGAYDAPDGSSLHGYYFGWPGFQSGHVSVIWLGSDSGRFIPSYFTTNHNFYGDPFSLHPSGINVSMADGSVRKLSRDIDWPIVYAIFQKNEQSNASLEFLK